MLSGYSVIGFILITSLYIYIYTQLDRYVCVYIYIRTHVQGFGGCSGFRVYRV